MELDELKSAWAAHSARLERSLAIDERLLREVQVAKAQRALTPWVLARALEVLLGIVALVLAAPVLVVHLAEPRYLVAAGALVVFLVGATAMSAFLLVHGLRLAYEGPVAALQRELEGIRLAEYRALKWALLGGVVVWLPALLVLFEAVTGVPALARVDLAWLVSNLVFGLVVLGVGHTLSKRHLERAELGPRARKLVDALTGRGPRLAAARLAELASFVRDDQAGL